MLVDLLTKKLNSQTNYISEATDNTIPNQKQSLAAIQDNNKALNLKNEFPVELEFLIPLTTTDYKTNNFTLDNEMIRTLVEMEKQAKKRLEFKL